MIYGFEWTLSLVMFKGKTNTFIAKSWWGAMFLLSTFRTSVSILDLFEGECLSVHRIITITSWPIYCCLLVCALPQRTQAYNLATSDFLQPLIWKPSIEIQGYSCITSEKKAGFLSRATFSWMNSLLKTGYSKSLDLEDIPFIASEDQAKTNYQGFLDSWESQKNNPISSKPSSLCSLANFYLMDLLFTGFCAFFRTASVTVGPLLLCLFVDYASGDKKFDYEGYVLAGGLLFIKTVESFSQRHWYFEARRLGMKIRSALIAAIHQKQMCLSNLGKREHGVGEIVNYIGIDAYRIGDFPWWVHWIWIIPLQISTALIIFCITVGFATVPGIVLIFLVILISSPMAKVMQICQNQLMEAQDERLRATTEVLNGIKVIKLQAWEDRFKALVDKLRDKEFWWLRRAQITRAYGTILYWVSPIVVGSVIFFTCIFLEVPLTATNIFTVLATFRIIQEPVRMVPDVLAAVIQVNVSLHRIDKFLQADELQSDAVERKVFKETEHAIRMENCTLTWHPKMEEQPALEKISMSIQHKQKVAICGTIGSGKSTLLQSILGEVPKSSGTICVSGHIAYVAQSAWIQTGTVKDNILFGNPMDELHYTKTLQSCALEQDIANFSHGDLTEIGERGINLSGGQKQRIQLARAVYSNADIYLLDDPFSAVDADTASSLFHDCILGALLEKTVVLITHQVEFLPAFDSILVMHEGKIQQQGTYERLLQESSTFKTLLHAHQEALTSVIFPKGVKEQDFELNCAKTKKGPSPWANHESTEEISGIKSLLVQDEERETGHRSLKPYFDYISISGGSLVLAAMMFGQIAFVATNVSSSIWLATEISNPGVSEVCLIGVYTILSAISGAFVFMRSRLSAELGLKASKSFYERLMSSVFKAPMSFFDSTPTGRILSRASGDLSILDLNIPFSFGFVMAGLFDLIGIILVVALVTWQILFVTLPMLLVVHKLQAYYMASCRELSRMNSSSKSPILNNSSEIMYGSITIRAFQKTENFERKNMQLVDRDASLFYHIQGAAEWLSIRIEAAGNLLLFVATLLLVSLPENRISPGFAGLAVSYALAINSSQIGFVWWQCCLENYIVSVERIEQYMQIPEEEPKFIQHEKPPTDWPSEGKVMLADLKIRYKADSPLVLKGVTCTFEGGQKIGVVGRTGSGKTTLISALFRLVEPSGGSILIDNINICSIGLRDLRLRLGIIPQDPVLFRGTVRSNLDPLSQYSDAEIWEVLDKCQLGHIIRRLPEQLDTSVDDEGQNWSGGQRQLFCLGRVLLKRCRVLVLDEATASVDAATDALLQSLLRKEFRHCTVITVAHRIPTVICSDNVLALRNGQLVEFGPPRELLQQQASLFARLVAEYSGHNQLSNEP